MIEINPREVAATVLMSVTENGEYNNIALRKALKQNGAMSTQDKGFVTEVVNGTLRNIIYIDYLINDVSSLHTEKMKPWILAVLRIAVYQFCFMKVPESAAVNESVNLVKERGLGKLASFANGVLRNAAKGKDSLQLPDEKTDPAEYLHIRYSHPLWLVKMWLSQYDYEFVRDLCAANNQAPGVHVIVNPLKTTKEALKKELLAEDILAEDSPFFDGGLNLSKLKDISRLPAFEQGKFHVQDGSSALAVKILNPQKGETLLDICAAPGGKSFLAAELMENSGKVVSRDLFEHKIDLMKETASRLGLGIIKTELKDAAVYHEGDEKRYDRVIVDAPCTGFGLLRKKPDIRLHRDGSAIDTLVPLQREILKNAARYVAPGGVLVYSTCTICKKENMGNRKWFLENFDFEAEDITSLLPKGLDQDSTKEGYLHLFPNIHGCDGFFIARFKRKE